MSATHEPLRLVSGEPDVRQLVEELQAEIRDLHRQLNAVRTEIKRDVIVTVLGLLHSALRKVAAGEVNLASVEAHSPAASSKWDAIKQRNPGRIAEAIDVLQAHGAMNASQLAAAMRMDRSNCSKNVVPKLTSMGLLVRNGRMFSLKEL